jgi:integrase
VGHIKDRWKTDPSRIGKNPESRYQVWVTVEGRAKYVGAYRTQAIARRHLVENESRAQRGAWVDMSDDTTVTEGCRRYAATRPHRASTAKRVERLIGRQIAPAPLGSLRLVAVRPSDVQSWVTGLSAAGLAPGTVRAAVRLLAAVYNAAVLDRRVSSSPVVRIALPRDETERVVPLTVDQVRAIADAVAARCRAMVLVQAGLGLRVGELLALRLQDVNFLQRVVRIEHQLERGTRARVAPKTPRSRRSIPLPSVVAATLAEHIRQWPPLPDGSLFYGTNGRPYDHDVYGSRIFSATSAKLAEAKGSTFPAGITSHDCRHHYASILLAAGESVVAVAERLGHDSAEMVLRVYGHLLPDSEDRTRRAVDDAWGTPPGAPRGVATAQGRPE